MKPEEILYALISIFVNHIPAGKVAEKLSCSRNTINRYKKKFDGIRNEVEDFIRETPKLKDAPPCRLRNNAAARSFMDRYTIKSHRRKCTYETREVIREYCEAYFNYYIYKRSPHEFACKLLNEFSERLYKKHNDDLRDIIYIQNGKTLTPIYLRDRQIEMIKQHLIDYPGLFSCDFQKYDFLDQQSFRRYMKSITTLRGYLQSPRPVRKNYEEVYLKFQESDCYKTTPISYEAFFKIACKFWGKEKYQYDFFHDIKCVNSDNEKKKNS